MFLFLWFLVFSFSVPCFEFNVISKDFITFFLSLQLTGVETLESVSQNFKRRFHFLFLVSVAVHKRTARCNRVDEA